MWEMWDAFIDVWAIAAGGFEFPAEVSDKQRCAASVLLGLPEVGLMSPWRGDWALRLKALGGDPWQGVKTLPRSREEREMLFQTVFGARKRVIGDLGLPADKLDPGTPPWSLATHPEAVDRPPAATARQLIAWCRDRQVETEVVDGEPFVGEDLTEWNPGALVLADEELAETPVTLRLFFPRGNRALILVPPGRESPWKVGACQNPRSQCETECPLFGRQVCAQYSVGIGWGWDPNDPGKDPRRIREMPAYTRA